jgi:O-antigen/teichoic acid export membrane protein
VAALTGSIGAIQLAGLLTARRGARADHVDRTYARRMTLISALAVIDTRLDILLTGLLLGARDAGLVAAARLFPGLVKTFWTVLYQRCFPSLAAGSVEDGRALVRRYRTLLVSGVGVVAAVGSLLAPFLIRALFGAHFEGAVTLTRLLLAAAFVSSFGFLDLTLVRAQGDLRREGVVLAVLATLSLVALAPLILLLGIEGVGVEALIAAVAYSGLAMYLARRTVPQLQSR